jgi:DNA modification methylase
MKENTADFQRKPRSYSILKGRRGKYDIRNKLNNLTGKEWIKITASIWEFEEDHLTGLCKNIIRMFTSNLDTKDILVYNDCLQKIDETLVRQVYDELEEDVPSFKIKHLNPKELHLIFRQNQNLRSKRAPDPQKRLNTSEDKFQLTVSFINKHNILNKCCHFSNQDLSQVYISWLENEAQFLAQKMFSATDKGKYSIVILDEFDIAGRKINIANHVISCFANTGFEFRGKITSYDKKTLNEFSPSHTQNISNIHKYVLIFYRQCESHCEKHQIKLQISGKIPRPLNKKINLPSIVYSRTKVDEIGKIHPATYSYIDIQYLIQQFVGMDKKAVIFDPFLGVASTAIAAQMTGNISVGCELNQDYIYLSKERLERFSILNTKIIGEKQKIQDYSKEFHYIISGDSTTRIGYDDIPAFDYCVTSPPYHSILRNDGKGVRDDNSQFRQGVEYYSEAPNDLGNQETFEGYKDLLCKVMHACHKKLKDGCFCSIVISDFTVDKKEKDISGEIINLMGSIGFAYVGTIVLVQSQKVLYPFGYPYKFTLNHVNQFVINFRK